MVVHIVGTSIFFMNMIIAVLSNIYHDLIDKIDADYNANLVLAITKMKWDEKYGLLIFAFPPFNVISFILSPFLLLMHFCLKEKEIKRANTILCMITYCPIVIIIFIVFLAGNFIMFPFALLKSLILFPRIGKKKKPCYFLAWLIGCIPALLTYFLLDCLNFFILVYRRPFHMKQKVSP